MTKLTKSLKADLPALAELLRSKGKGNDSILAHINPREAALLKRHGGSGDINPDTGLPMFDDGEVTFDTPPPTESYGPPVTSANADVQQNYTGAQAQGGTPVPTDFSIGQTQDVADMAAGATAGQVPQGQGITGGLVGPASVYSPTGTSYSQADLDRFSLGQNPEQQPIPQQAAAAAPKAPDKGGFSTESLVKALGLGGLGLLGVSNVNRAGAQNQQAQAQQQAIASPYQAQGQEMIQAAQRGELTPQSQQAYQAAMAQANQQMAGRGGVGQAQMQQQMANLYNTLLQNQYTYGLSVAQIGDNIAVGAIKQGLQLDQSLQQTTQNFYMQLASIASGAPIIAGTRVQ
jgi:hypothetical protein